MKERRKRKPVAGSIRPASLRSNGTHLVISGIDIVVKEIDRPKIQSAHLPSDQHFPTLQELEREYIHRVLSHFDYNRTKAAEVLGIDRVSLWRKIKKHEASTGQSKG
ncbi:MAG: helix-turn-helix domain-containing protein [Desulfurivibrionaceae bacterium]|nr:helix-turn-helix domain-containing protein [Desulfobacterales bacterium]MDT8335363.1 helix-turn-helix domain-containing protein [Desulfurivibrionaceae bacterium]